MLHLLIFTPLNTESVYPFSYGMSFTSNYRVIKIWFLKVKSWGKQISSDPGPWSIFSLSVSRSLMLTQKAALRLLSSNFITNRVTIKFVVKIGILLKVKNGSFHNMLGLQALALGNGDVWSASYIFILWITGCQRDNLPSISFNGHERGKKWYT